MSTDAPEVATPPDHAATRADSRRPRRVLWGAVLVVLAWLVVAGLGGAAQGKLSGVQSNDNSTFLPEGAESTLVSQAVAALNESDTLPYLVVVQRADGAVLTPQDLQAVTQFAAGIPALELPELGEGATLGDYLVGDTDPVPIPSQDGEAVLVSVPLDATTGTEASGETSALVEGAEALRAEIAASLAPAGLEGNVGGPGGLIADFAEAFAGIDGILLGVALLVVLVILLVVYRSPILPFAVLLSAVFGLSAASLVVYQLALNDVITLSGQSQGILFILVVGACTDYAL
ncbi:MAG TPA: MMPL family transporter, partial [Ornithinibacter sp.]|nr:MMPL family transporter [Ornithinibacter sp.]